MEEPSYINHLESAENMLQELLAEKEAHDKLEVVKRKAEAERAVREALEHKKWVDETNWQMAIVSNTVASFEQYIGNQENQLYRQEATQRLKELKMRIPYL